MEKKIKSALISVFYKDGLAPLAKTLQAQNITIYSTGGTQKFLEDLLSHSEIVEYLEVLTRIPMNN